MSTEFIYLSKKGATVPPRAMLSVRDTAIGTQKFSAEFEQCSCSVPLVLSNTALPLYDQVTDIRPRQSSGVVTTFTGNPPQNSPQIKPHANCAYAACSCTPCSKVDLRYFNGSVMYKPRNRMVQCHDQNACHWSQP